MLTFKSLRLAGFTASGACFFIAAGAWADDAPTRQDRLVGPPPAFADIDTNRNGAISQAEFDRFQSTYESLRLEHDLPPPPLDGKRMRIRIMNGEGLDADKDGKVTFEEFSGPVKAHFTELDANKNGVLDPDEVPKDHLFERRRRS